MPRVFLATVRITVRIVPYAEDPRDQWAHYLRSSRKWIEHFNGYWKHNVYSSEGDPNHNRAHCLKILFRPRHLHIWSRHHENISLCYACFMFRRPLSVCSRWYNIVIAENLQMASTQKNGRQIYFYNFFELQLNTAQRSILFSCDIWFVAWKGLKHLEQQ
jgi:hypothetical protein